MLEIAEADDAGGAMGRAAVMARRIFVDADDAAAAAGEARHGGAAHGAEADNDCIERHQCVLKSCEIPDVKALSFRLMRCHRRTSIARSGKHRL